MIVPLVDTLQLDAVPQRRQRTGLRRARQFPSRCSPIRAGRVRFWNALRNNVYFFVFHMLLQNPIGIALAALLSLPDAARRGVLPHGVLPADDAVLRDRRLRLEADPVAALGRRADAARLRRPEKLFQPWLGQDNTR